MYFIRTVYKSVNQAGFWENLDVRVSTVPHLVLQGSLLKSHYLGQVPSFISTTHRDKI